MHTIVLLGLVLPVVPTGTTLPVESYNLKKKKRLAIKIDRLAAIIHHRALSYRVFSVHAMAVWTFLSFPPPFPTQLFGPRSLDQKVKA